jgi:hypothetical protein
MSRAGWPTGTYNEQLRGKDVAWQVPSGEQMSIEQWRDGQAGERTLLLFERSARRTRNQEQTCENR